MYSQLKKENFIPIYIALGFSLLMFIFMAIPHSQYSLLGEMTALNNNVNEQGELLPINIFTVIPAIATLFTILFLAVIFLLSIVSLFFDRFYNFHSVATVIFIFFFLTVISENIYFVFGLQGQFDNGERVILPFNYVTPILTNLAFIGFVFTFFKFIQQKYMIIKHEINTSVISSHTNEMKDEPQEKTIVKQTNEDMKKMILDMLSQGKISSEEAYKILDEIDKHH